MNNYQLLSEISPSIFRAYDIRGIVGNGLDDNVIYTLGRAIGSAVLSANQNQILMGCDGRLSSPSLIKALGAGLLESGCTIVDLGRVPTPFLYFATQFLNIASGVMLTASHNPAAYNGLKIIVNHETLAEQKILALYECIQKQDFYDSKVKGKISNFDITTPYINYLKNDISLKKKLKIVMDCGNGIVGPIAPKLFKTLGCEVIELFCEADGNFPNHPPDTSNPENLKDLISAVKYHQADLGIAFDGDGDRIVAVTNEGLILWPDRLMMLYAQDVLNTSQKNNTIICDIKCSRNLINWIENLGGFPLLWKTGHSLIKAKLKETDAILAGEMSGHIFFNDGRWFGFDDGLYAGARLLEILSQDFHSSHKVFLTLPDSVNTPELKVPMEQKDKFLFVEKFKKHITVSHEKINTIDGVRVEFEKGWGLIRASNTTECLVLRFEAEDYNNLKLVQEFFRKAILAVDQEMKLPF